MNLEDITSDQILIDADMEHAYAAYAGSVIIGRALPDVRDGFKPVHRRILYSMYEAGLDHNKPYRKSSKVVGDVMSKYHPHGDASIYDAMVRLTQDFSMRVPLIDGQGNFGSIDGDSAAAMRYTEVRMEKIAHSMLTDIEKETVEWRVNYDSSEKEPTVLPTSFPNILFNGSSGVAVGMATNIPPFNVGEVIDACVYYIQNKGASPEDVVRHMKGPDFPTGGTILGLVNTWAGMMTGRSVIIVQGKAEIEEKSKKNSRNQIVITEIPYQVNKVKMIERIVELVKEKRIEGIADIRDESSLEGIRVVIELKNDAEPKIVLNRLYKFSQLQSSFGINMLVIHNMRPRLMSVHEIIKAFVEWRLLVIERRIIFELSKLRAKVHIIIGLLIAISNLDDVIKLIRVAEDSTAALLELTTRQWKVESYGESLRMLEREFNAIDESGYCNLSEEQAKAILDLKLHRLTKLEKDKLLRDIEALTGEVQKCLTILNSQTKMEDIIVSELTEIKREFGTPRRTRFEENYEEQEIEDLVTREEMVVTVTNSGLIKRVSLSSYRAQNRGGKGKSGQSMGDTDSVSQIFTANTRTNVLFFFNSGLVYKSKVFKLPEGEPSTKGRAAANVFPVGNSESINKVIPMPEDQSAWEGCDIVFVTKLGNIRRNSLESFRNVPSNGKIAIRFDENSADSLIDVSLAKGEDHIFMATYKGKAIRFPLLALRVTKSRVSIGVRGMKLAVGDYIVSAVVIASDQFDTLEERDQYLSIPYETRLNAQEKSQEISKKYNFEAEKLRTYSQMEELILVVTENGFGKFTSSYEYRITNRGGSGITNILTSSRNGGVVASFPARPEDEIMLITDKGQVIRIGLHAVRVSGRNTQGVKLFSVAKDEKVKSVTKILSEAKVVEGVEQAQDAGIGILGGELEA